MKPAYRVRFRLSHDPLPRNASGKTCFVDADDLRDVSQHFHWLAAEPGPGLLTGEPGLGKTTLLRHLCDSLPRPEHKIIYICDTAATPVPVYRNLAAELGIQPQYRRDALWRQLKAELRRLIEQHSIVPILVLDEAQHLGDDFFADLSDFLNYAFDRSTLLTVWLCGLPLLRSRLDLKHHAPLRDRVIAPKRLRSRKREELRAMLEHGLLAAGGDPRIIADSALEVLYRASRGVPRSATHLLRLALMTAHDRDQNFVDEDTMLAACDVLELTRPEQEQPQHPTAPRAKPRK